MLKDENKVYARHMGRCMRYLHNLHYATHYNRSWHICNTHLCFITRTLFRAIGPVLLNVTPLQMPRGQHFLHG